MAINTKSAQTWLGVLDHLAEVLTVEHVEMAHQLDCTPEQLRARNGKMSQLLRSDFTGYGWPFGWRYGRADAGKPNGATMYEIHPQVADRWKAAHLPISECAANGSSARRRPAEATLCSGWGQNGLVWR